jgi:hypothetical protein
MSELATFLRNAFHLVRTIDLATPGEEAGAATLVAARSSPESMNLAATMIVSA